MHFQIHEGISYPSDEFIDKSKLNLLIYTAKINLMISENYKELLDEVMALRTKIFCKENVLNCAKEFNQLGIRFIVCLINYVKMSLVQKLLDELMTFDLLSTHIYFDFR